MWGTGVDLGLVGWVGGSQLSIEMKWARGQAGAEAEAGACRPAGQGGGSESQEEVAEAGGRGCGHGHDSRARQPTSHRATRGLAHHLASLSFLYPSIFHITLLSDEDLMTMMKEFSIFW